MTVPKNPLSIDIWITKPAKESLEKWLTPDMNGLEFGSGCSTIWIAQRVKTLMSVEHDENWYNRVKTLLREHKLGNVNLVLQKSNEYTSVLNHFSKGVLDFVFNDGLADYRSECIIGSWNKLRKGGIMIIDNSEAWHSRKGIIYIENDGAIGTRYWGPVMNPWTGRYNERGVETGIWVK